MKEAVVTLEEGCQRSALYSALDLENGYDERLRCEYLRVIQRIIELNEEFS